MCGITGIYYKNSNKQVAAIDLEKSNNRLFHRGPDEGGIFTDGNIGLAMRRLSIVDITRGHQPMSTVNHSHTIVFNGEIYNHQYLRKKLSSKRYQFRTNSDTETLLCHFIKNNSSPLDDLNGMFALAIWNAAKKDLFIARDRLGIKPLFYYEDDEKFIFASEIKAILAYPNVDKTKNTSGILKYFTYNYIPAPETIYTHIKKLPPGHFITVKNNTVAIQKYWDIKYQINPAWTLASASKKLQELLSGAIKYRLISDVPLGAFLSGGIDSSTIAAIINGNHLKDELHTFSVGFQTRSNYNELPFSSLMARKLNTHHHTKVVAPDMVSLLPKIIESLDEPMADPSNIPTYLLSEFTRKKVTVALSGDGADELFAGYERQKILQYMQWFNYLPDFIKKNLFSRINSTEQKDGFINSVKRLLVDISRGNRRTYQRWITNFNETVFQQLLNSDLKKTFQETQRYATMAKAFQYAQHPINQSLAFETQYYLPDDLLVKVDRMSMAHSLEVRVPFLDHRIVEFAASLPIDLKIRQAKTKYLLKHLMSAYLPKEIIKKPKQGFSPPLKEWLKTDLKAFTYQRLLESRRLSTYFDREQLENFLSAHYRGDRDYQYQIWSLLVFSGWLEAQ